LTECHLVW